MSLMIWRDPWIGGQKERESSSLQKPCDRLNIEELGSPNLKVLVYKDYPGSASARAHGGAMIRKLHGHGSSLLKERNGNLPRGNCCPCQKWASTPPREARLHVFCEGPNERPTWFGISGLERNSRYFGPEHPNHWAFPSPRLKEGLVTRQTVGIARSDSETWSRGEYNPGMTEVL